MSDSIRSVRVPAFALTAALLFAAGLAGCGDNRECQGECPTAGQELCDAPGDEDADGAADCADSDCAAAPACQEQCGNGVQNIGEGCDDGNQVDTDACTNECQRARCGDGITGPGEQCDDNNTTNTDACTNACQTARCGDGIPGPGEQCDDGNMVDNDGCNNQCQMMRCGDGIVGPGEACDDGNMDNTDACTNACALPSCGDGFMQAGEQCDDGNQVTTDGCLNTCMVAVCGDGVLRDDATVTEECDDGDALADDGCDALCQVEDGYVCAMTPSVCTTVCGDGIIAGGETCDQGNNNVTPGDGCSATCTTEMGWLCSGEPSVCSDTCGNGTVEAGEQCDDGNPTEDDGCSSVCVFDIGCAAGETQIAVTSDTPVPIPDVMSGTSTVTITSADRVSRMLVYLDITHTWTSDVDISLTGPRMITRDLSSDNGSSGDHYTRTYFDDRAATPITAAVPPYTGIFRPEQALGHGGFRGQAAGGDWTLTATDDAAGIAGTLNTWTLLVCTSPLVPVCGNGNIEAGEECDDGNDVPDDACNNSCGILEGCGDGNLDAGEQCDDDNQASADGCSATCTVDIGCPAGEMAVSLTNSMVTPIPDNDQVTGVSSTVTVPVTGAVTTARVFISSLTHTAVGDLDIYLAAPDGTIRRELSTDLGGTNDNLQYTLFTDQASATLSGTAPYIGSFRPEQSLTTTAGVDLLRTGADGTWTLRIFDDAANNTGTLNEWTLLMCVDPAATYCGDGMTNGGEECDDGNTNNTDTCSNLCLVVDGCGDGNLDGGETCDDDNLTAGDGCSATCTPELTCPAGQMAVIASSTMSTAIPDNDQVNGVSSTVNVGVTGAVTDARVYLASITHTNNADLDIYLTSPGGPLRRELSTDNGSSGDNYRNTIFDDAAASAITSGSSPFSGRYRAEQTLATTANTDFERLNANGTWTLRVFDDASGGTGTLDNWSLLLCVDPATTYCGDGMINGGEECDDGNSNNADACNNACQISDGCGDGNVDAGEQCDDNNVTSGDGCSATCMHDITCGAGEMAVIVSNSTPLALPDNTVAGVLSPIDVATAGLVRKVLATVNVTHGANSDVEIYLMSPYGGQRDLSTDNGGANHSGTIFSDAAAVTIPTAGASAAPFTGQFRPEQSLDAFHGQSAGGEWILRVADDEANTTGGVLDSWTLALCVDPSASRVCGNGVVEATETCDDGNTVDGDGCSMACAVELGCAAGEVEVVTTSDDEKLQPADNNTTGVTSNVTVAGAGNVTRAVVVLNALTHSFDADLDLTLIAPNAATVELSSDNGSSGDDYLSTILADGAATAVTSGTAPFRGRFRPEGMLSAVNGQAGAGEWGLRVVDDLGGDSGVLRTWSIGLCLAP